MPKFTMEMDTDAKTVKCSRDGQDYEDMMSMGMYKRLDLDEEGKVVVSKECYVETMERDSSSMKSSYMSFKVGSTAAASVVTKCASSVAEMAKGMFDRIRATKTLENVFTNRNTK
jgi:hypothetical protein